MRLLVACTMALLLAGPGYTQTKARNPAKATWSLVVSTDRMTDERVCALIYAPDPHVVYRANDELVVSYVRRGGVAHYRWRVDKQQASGLQTPEGSDSNYVRIPVWYSNFVDGKKLLIEGRTVTERPIDLEIDLRGLKAARNEMSERCSPMPELQPEPASGPPPGGWPAPPASLSGGAPAS